MGQGRVSKEEEIGLCCNVAIMPTKSVTFYHSIGDRVLITALEKCEGIVESLTYCVDGHSYRVAYWHDGKRCSEWLRPEEITVKNVH